MDANKPLRTPTPEQLAEADALDAVGTRHYENAAESFDRCDTDGFLSQWASGMNGDKNRLAARILRNGGVWAFPALLTLDGQLVPAKLIPTRYGVAWGVFANAADAQSRNARVAAWVSWTTEKALARKGYKIGYVVAPARAELQGANVTAVRAVAVRTDGGFDPNAEILPDGYNPCAPDESNAPDVADEDKNAGIPF